ncbi:MAG: ribonuclease Y [Clostridiales bacterium]|nr:ribonuclease Y [Candidatus Blautia equi]
MTSTTIIVAIVAVIVTLLIAVPVSCKVAVSNKAKKDAAVVATAEDKARSIIDDALKTAETKKREALLEVKEESLRTKNELERETKERRNELQKYEKRVLAKEESIDKKEEAVDKKAAAVEKRESDVTARIADLQKKEKRVEELELKGVQELERVSGLTSEQAKQELLKRVEDDVKVDVARLYKELESRAKEDANKKAKEYVVNAIQKCAVDHVSETTISVVQLPSDEMKGRIIGREGRNIRTLETMTGVDLIIDDTPEAVVLSSFDPIRREVARVALEKLIVDGRIHPARIEEMVEKAQKEVDAQIREDGETAAMDVGVHGIHPELLKLLGRMRFRSSYGQNALKHSIEVAQLSGILAGEVGVDVRMAKRAGLLHDIGKSIDHEVEGSHIQIGVDLCKKYKESAIVINAVASHHGDVEPESLIACIVQAADAISAARPGARRETLEAYTNRLKQLEDITNEFKGVERSFAIQAGREIRVMVVPEHVNDAEMVLLARDIAKQIEAELEYPGQIKVNVIRESRAVDYAK